MDRYAKIVGTKGEIMIPNYNRIIDYTIHWNDGTTETKSYPFKGNDMTMQIQDTKGRKCNANHAAGKYPNARSEDKA